MTQLPSLSVFFPAFNEEANVEGMVSNFKNILPQIAKDYEIIIVNDGSRDRTREIAESLVEQNQKVRAVHHEKNLGYGAAIRSGITACRKDFIFFTDGDNQFNLGQLSTFTPLIMGCDCVIGFRINRQDSRIRKMNAWAWNRLVSFLFGLRVKDIDCAFKLFRRQVFDGLPLESSGALISTEMLIKIQERGYRFQEVGVLHSPRLVGKQTGAHPRVILKAFKELFHLYGKLKPMK